MLLSASVPELQGKYKKPLLEVNVRSCYYNTAFEYKKAFSKNFILIVA